MRRENKGYNAFMIFSKFLNNCIITPDIEGTEYGYIKVTYNQGSKPNPNKKGRWYSNKSIGLAPLCCCVRHTICDGILVDGVSPYKSSVLKELKDEIKPCIDTIINLPEYSSTLEYVKKTYDNNIEGKTISRILRMIENGILESYFNFFYNEGFINKLNDGYEVSLIFDGFQIRSEHNITDDTLNECRKYALDKTGYDIELKIKPFDNPLILPTNYNIVLDKIPSIVDKYTTYITEFYDKNIQSINNIIINFTDHDIFKLISVFSKDKIVYDPNTERWFYCNLFNVWKEYKDPIIIKAIVPTIIHSLFERRNKYYVEILYKISLITNTDDPLLKLYGIKESESIIEFTFRIKKK